MLSFFGRVVRRNFHSQKRLLAATPGTVSQPSTSISSNPDAQRFQPNYLPFRRGTNTTGLLTVIPLTNTSGGFRFRFNKIGKGVVVDVNFFCYESFYSFFSICFT